MKKLSLVMVAIAAQSDLDDFSKLKTDLFDKEEYDALLRGVIMRDNLNRDIEKDRTDNSGVRPWENGKVRWCADPNLSDQALNVFMLATEQYKKAFSGCISFEKVSNSNGNCEDYPRSPAIFLRSDQSMCASASVGAWNRAERGKRRYDLHLGESCKSIASGIREIAYLLGMKNEHNRSNRDSQVKINRKNMKQGVSQTFKKRKNDIENRPYDY